MPDSDAERAIEQLARSGCNIVFTTSFGFMDPTIKVAKKFPNVKFEHATGYKRAPNVSTYAAKFYEGRYVMGQIAGKMTKSNTIGYIVSFPIPEVVSGIDAFERGLQTTNPNAKIKIVWVNTWFDPGKEADAAKALIAQGADILTQHTDSAAPLQEAEKAGVLGFGQSSDMARFAPKAQLTANTDNWGPYYAQRIQAVIDGDVEVGRHLGRHRQGHGRARAVRQHARRRQGDGDQDHRGHRFRRAAPLRLPGPRPGRQGSLQAGRQGAARRRHPVDELVRQGNRRQGAAIRARPRRPARARVSERGRRPPQRKFAALAPFCRRGERLAQ